MLLLLQRLCLAAAVKLGFCRLDWWLHWQERKQLQTDSQQSRRQIESLKEKLDEERKRVVSAEAKVSELTEKLKNAENVASMTSSRLNQESSSLANLSKSQVRLATVW